MTDPLNIIFDSFGIWLLGYRIEFSCLNIPQAHYFIRSLWLKYRWIYFFYYFERKCTFKKVLHSSNRKM